MGPSSGEMAVTLHDLLDSGLCPLFKCLFLFYFPTFFKLFSEILKCWKAFWRKILSLPRWLYAVILFFPFVKKKKEKEKKEKKKRKKEKKEKKCVMYVTHSCCTMALVLYVCPYFSLTPAHIHTQQFSLESCNA